MYIQSIEFFHKANQVLELANWAEVPESRVPKMAFLKTQNQASLLCRNQVYILEILSTKFGKIT